MYLIICHCCHFFLFVFLHHLDIFTFCQDFIFVIAVLRRQRQQIDRTLSLPYCLNFFNWYLKDFHSEGCFNSWIDIYKPFVAFHALRACFLVFCTVTTWIAFCMLAESVLSNLQFIFERLHLFFFCLFWLSVVMRTSKCFQRTARKAVVVYMKDQGFSSCSYNNYDKTISYNNEMDWFMIGQKQQAAFTDEAHCKLPSTNNQFLTLSWFAKGFIFVHINLKPQNISLLLLVKLLLLFFFFSKELE